MQKSFIKRFLENREDYKNVEGEMGSEFINLRNLAEPATYPCLFIASPSDYNNIDYEYIYLEAIMPDKHDLPDWDFDYDTITFNYKNYI